VIEAIIFDMDGLMIDSERLYFQVEREIARQHGKEVSEEILWRMMGRKPIESARIFVVELGLATSAEELLKTRDSMMLEKLKTDLQPMPGLNDIINRFYPQLKLAIATGAPKNFLDIVLQQLNIGDKFAVLQTSDNVEIGKPDPQIYLKTCARLDLLPGQCVVLEDSQNGVKAAKAAGCYVVAVPSEFSGGQGFGIADFIAADLFQAGHHIEEQIGKKVG
jgi:HAD superfamily hydrolase (TIGR01509 family)